MTPSSVSPSPHPLTAQVCSTSPAGRPDESTCLPGRERKRKVRRWLGIFVVLCGGVLLGVLLGGKRQSHSKFDRAILVADPVSLNLGTVDAATDFPWKLTIRNVSDGTIRVVGFKTSCDCAQIDPHPLTLEAGQSTDVTLRINLGISGSAGVHTHQAPVDVRIVPLLDGIVEPQKAWRLTGTIVAPCLLESDRIVFAGSEAIVAGGPTSPRMLRASLVADNISVTAIPEFAEDQITITHLQETSRAIAISVQPSANRPLGWFTSHVELVSRDDDGNPRGSVRFEIRGEVVPAFRVYPKVLTLGPRPIGSVIEEQLIVDW